MYFTYTYLFLFWYNISVQVGAEIQDARDLLSTLCKHHLPDRHWRLVFEVVDEVDPSGSTGLLSGFDMDPSVQFFGIDWERAFGRCYGLSMQIKQLEVLLKEDPEVEIDILLINRMLRDLAAIEADVQSHSEAVLRGRLSKSQRQLIFDEQSKYAALTIVSKPSHKVSIDLFSSILITSCFHKKKTIFCLIRQRYWGGRKEVQVGVDSNTRNPTIWLEIDYFFGIWAWLELDY